MFWSKSYTNDPFCMESPISPLMTIKARFFKVEFLDLTFLNLHFQMFSRTGLTYTPSTVEKNACSSYTCQSLFFGSGGGNQQPSTSSLGDAHTRLWDWRPQCTVAHILSPCTQVRRPGWALLHQSPLHFYGTVSFLSLFTAGLQGNSLWLYESLKLHWHLTTCQAPQFYRHSLMDP